MTLLLTKVNASNWMENTNREFNFLTKIHFFFRNYIGLTWQSLLHHWTSCITIHTDFGKGDGLNIIPYLMCTILVGSFWLLSWALQYFIVEAPPCRNVRFCFTEINKLEVKTQFFWIINLFLFPLSYPWDMSIDRNMAISVLFQCFATPALIYFMIVPQLLFMAISLYFETMIDDMKAIIDKFDYHDIPKLKLDFTETINLHTDSLEWVLFYSWLLICINCKSLFSSNERFSFFRLIGIYGEIMSTPIFILNSFSTLCMCCSLFGIQIVSIFLKLTLTLLIKNKIKVNHFFYNLIPGVVEWQLFWCWSGISDRFFLFTNGVRIWLFCWSDQSRSVQNEWIHLLFWMVQMSLKNPNVHGFHDETIPKTIPFEGLISNKLFTTKFHGCKYVDIIFFFSTYNQSTWLSYQLLLLPAQATQLVE